MTINTPETNQPNSTAENPNAAAWRVDPTAAATPEQTNNKETEQKVGATGMIPQDLLREVAKSSDDKALVDRLTRLADKLDQQLPLDDETRDFVDGVLAELTINDDGTFRDDVEADRWQNVRRWLTGDSELAPNIEAKREILRQHETALQMGEIAAHTSYIEWSEFMDGVEPIPLERLALVRSSEFPFETNQAGEVIVYPAAEYDPNFVRQSIHFTIGHEVASHTDEWSKSNYLVVSNLDRAIDRNGKLSSMGPVDSWFTVEPHEAVILPDAVIISPTDDPRAELLAQDKSSRVITYKDLPEADYSSEDIAKLQQLIDEADPGIRFIINRLLPPFTRNFDRIEYPINERLRTLSLAIALHQVGVGPSDVPEGGGGSHGTKDSDFDRRISKTAAEHQMAERKHFGSRDRGGGFDENTHNFVRQHLGTGYEVRSTVTGRQALDPDMPLAAKRRLLLSGGIVTENLPVSRAAIDDFDMVF